MAIYANIPIDQGTTFSSVVTVTGANGLVFDLTGYTAKGQIRKSYASTTSTAFTCTIPNPETGNINISLTATQTAALKAGRYLYDLGVTRTENGKVLRVVEGQIDVNPRVTR
jgi:hypothetical protein